MNFCGCVQSSLKSDNTERDEEREWDAGVDACKRCTRYNCGRDVTSKHENYSECESAGGFTPMLTQGIKG